MPFGRKAGAVRCYEYGCGQPLAGEAECIEEMHGRVRLWNNLVALDREYDTRREALLAPHFTVPNDEEHREQYRAERKAAFAREDVKAALQALDKVEYEEARALWLASGLYWVNHEEVKLAWQAARRKPGELRFHAWRDEVGKVSVRWQNGLAVDDACGTDTQFQFLPAESFPDQPGSRWQPSKRGLRANVQMLRLRVGSENRKPVWLTLPVVLHRPLPPAGVIRSASVLRERVGTHWRWKLVVVVALPESVPVPASDKAISIDLGWRIVSDGLRVAFWSALDGAGEVVLDQKWLAGVRKIEDIQSIRDQRFDAARGALALWLERQAALPEWLTERTKTLGRWRSASRLAALALHWRDARFAGDDAILAQLEAWRQRDRHLCEYECNQRDQLLRDRREQYRRFAAWVVRRYGKVVVEDFNLAVVAKRRGTAGKGKSGNGPASDLYPLARRNRVLAAPSILRLALKNACEREGVGYEQVEAAYTSMVCPDCGSLERYDHAKELVHRCDACGAAWDQDYAATLNLAAGGVSQNPAVLAQKELLRKTTPETPAP